MVILSSIFGVFWWGEWRGREEQAEKERRRDRGRKAARDERGVFGGTLVIRPSLKKISS